MMMEVAALWCFLSYLTGSFLCMIISAAAFFVNLLIVIFAAGFHPHYGFPQTALSSSEEAGDPLMESGTFQPLMETPFTGPPLIMDFEYIPVK